MKIEYKGDLNKLFFTSDLHFCHENIIKYCDRPFENAADQSSKLIEWWNEIVPEDGVVFVAGDFIQTANMEATKSIVGRLNGTIHLIMGNHDYQNRLDREDVKKIFEYRTYDAIDLFIKDANEHFYISHYPHMYWPRNYYHLHGHVHSGPNAKGNEIVPFHHRRYDIGVDNNNYRPISYRNLIEKFDEFLETLINNSD